MRNSIKEFYFGWCCVGEIASQHIYCKLLSSVSFFARVLTYSLTTASCLLFLLWLLTTGIRLLHTATIMPRRSPSCWRDNQVKMWGRPSLIHYYFGGTCSPWSLLYFGTENRDIDTISSGSIYILSLNSKSFAPVIYLSAESEGPKSNWSGESKLFFFATGNRQNFFWQQVSIIFFFIKLGFSSHWTYLYRNKHWTLVHLRAFVSSCLCRSAHAEKKPLKGFQFLWALLVTPTHTRLPSLRLIRPLLCALPLPTCTDRSISKQKKKRRDCLRIRTFHYHPLLLMNDGSIGVSLYSSSKKRCHRNRINGSIELLRSALLCDLLI